MPRAEFHERQYELATNIELIAGRGDFFAPPTPLERRLGIDAALVPGDGRIWRMLGVTAPTGVSVGPGAFAGWPRQLPASAQPPFLVSLFIQYKRPDYLTRSSALEWGSHGRPFFRIHLAPHQHDLLMKLEAAVEPDAVVRYAVPEFWRHREMWLYQGAGEVLQRSVLVSPRSIGGGHHRWTWVRGQRGVAHSRPEDVPPEDVRGLVAAVTSRARERGRPAPGRHIASLAEAVEAAELTAPRERWREEVAAVYERRAPDEAIDEFAEIALIAEAAARVRASWLILALEEPGTD